MTKDELNRILKEQGMLLAFYRDGTNGKGFNILDNDRNILVKCNGLNIFYNSEWAFNKQVIEAMVAYINTPVEERQPKPQLYNIIIAEDVIHDVYYSTAYQKEKRSGEYSVYDSVEQHDLLHDDAFKFTIEEIEDLKSKVSDKQKQIIDIGIVKVETTND